MVRARGRDSQALGRCILERGRCRSSLRTQITFLTAAPGRQGNIRRLTAGYHGKLAGDQVRSPSKRVEVG